MEMPYKLEVLWCRTFQSVLKIGNYFLGYRMPKYLEGPGKIKELGAFLKEKGINDVLVVTGSGMVRRGQVQPMLDGFEENGIRYTVQTYDTTDPTSDDVELGYKTYKENGCKSIVALGGGSRIENLGPACLGCRYYRLALFVQRSEFALGCAGGGERRVDVLLPLLDGTQDSRESESGEQEKDHHKGNQHPEQQSRFRL